jgi:hypothetical protein
MQLVTFQCSQIAVLQIVFGHPASCILDTRDTWDSGSLSSFDISNNNLTQGEYDEECCWFDTDMTGVIALTGALPKW